MSKVYTRKDRGVPANAGWKHIDIRLNADGTFDIYLDSLGVVGTAAGKCAQIEGFRDTGIPTVEEALRNGKLIDEWLDLQSGEAAKRVTKAEKADKHYETKPNAPLVLEAEETPPPPPPEKKPAPPPPAPKQSKPAAKPSGGVNLNLFD